VPFSKWTFAGDRPAGLSVGEVGVGEDGVGGGFEMNCRLIFCRQIVGHTRRHDHGFVRHQGRGGVLRGGEDAVLLIQQGKPSLHVRQPPHPRLQNGGHRIVTVRAVFDPQNVTVFVQQYREQVHLAFGFTAWLGLPFQRVAGGKPFFV
jgi:hypothetical protein